MLLSTFISSQFPGGMQNLKNRSSRAFSSISHGLIETTEECHDLVKDAANLIEKDAPKVYELHGQGMPPSSWGDNTILVDCDYLKDTPYEVKKLLVAERILEASHGSQRIERNCSRIIMTVSAALGALVIGARVRQPATLRRAFVMSFSSLPVMMYATDRLVMTQPPPNYYLAKMLDGGKFNNQVVQQLLDYELYRQELFITRNKMVVKRHLPSEQQQLLVDREIRDLVMRITIIKTYHDKNATEKETTEVSKA